MSTSFRKGASAFALALIVAACSDATDPTSALKSASADAVSGKANGSGAYTQALPASLGGGSTTFTFTMNTIVDDAGVARGSFRHHGLIQGQVVDFKGVVTCASADAGVGRAWIGGVVTVNNSTHPSFTGAIHQVGKDAWFRVADVGNGGSGDADRSSFVGFEGGGGIITSAQYCAARIWPNEANPLVDGNVMVK